MGAKNRLAQAYYDMATLLDAGVPILRSLDLVAQGRRGRLARVFSQIRASLSKGSSLSESLGEHRRVFPELDRMLIEAAETGGSLPDSFKMLSHWHEFVERITRRIQMGLVYPFLLLHATAVIYPLPGLITSFFQGRTDTGLYVRQALQILLLLYVPLLIVVVSLHGKDRAKSLRVLLDAVVLRIPGLGKAVYHLSIYRYAQAFIMLYKAGVPMLECAERATLATGNTVVARMFAGGTASVRRGEAASTGFSRRLPPEYLHLWQIGEEAGELDQTIEKVAQMAQERADLHFTLFAQWLPRLVYFAVLGIMGYLIVSIGSQVYGGALWEF
ncbi:MAG: type II secretion system F family protein [Planctomycetes bacterium]|jgi:type IV pilus assembly protein PilC|nr:type II secretion system F family protein [Planctomycetota bacterium]